MNLPAIEQRTCELFGVTLDELRGRALRPRVTTARHCLWYVLRTCGWMLSYAEIGELCGGFDHTTVRSGVARVRQKAETCALAGPYARRLRALERAARDALRETGT